SVEILQKALEFVGPSDILVAQSQRYPIRGLRLAEHTECYEVYKNDRGAVKQTCTYVVGREAAKHILRVQNEGLWLADEFRVLCPDKGRLLFCNAFGHHRRISNIKTEAQFRDGLIQPRSLMFRLGDEFAKTVECRREQLRRAITRLGGHRVIGK